MIAENNQYPNRWKPGQSGNPAGRSPRQRELAVLDAINKEFPPDRIAELLGLAMKLAVELKSPRSISNVLELVIAYQLGKPVARTQNVESPFAELFQQALDEERAKEDSLRKE